MTLSPILTAIGALPFTSFRDLERRTVEAVRLAAEHERDPIPPNGPVKSVTDPESFS